MKNRIQMITCGMTIFFACLVGESASALNLGSLPSAEIFSTLKGNDCGASPLGRIDENGENLRLGRNGGNSLTATLVADGEGAPLGQVLAQIGNRQVRENSMPQELVDWLQSINRDEVPRQWIDDFSLTSWDGRHTRVPMSKASALIFLLNRIEGTQRARVVCAQARARGDHQSFQCGQRWSTPGTATVYSAPRYGIFGGERGLYARVKPGSSGFDDHDRHWAQQIRKDIQALATHFNLRGLDTRANPEALRQTYMLRQVLIGAGANQSMGQDPERGNGDYYRMMREQGVPPMP